MNYLFILLLPFALFVSGCATIHGAGTYAAPVNGNLTPDSFSADLKGSSDKTTEKGLLVSGSENSSLSSEYFTLVDFTFENKSAEWLKVTTVAVDFGSEKANSEIRFPVGQDLMDWAQSAQQIKAIRNYNMQMALGVAAGAGVAMSASGSKSTSNAGTAMAVGSGMVLAADNIGNKLDSLQRARVIPEDHLLSGNFSIPPGLFKRKWLTLYAKRPNDIPFINKMALTLTYDNGSTETVILKLRDASTLRSDFQKKNPEVVAAKKAASRQM